MTSTKMWKNIRDFQNISQLVNPKGPIQPCPPPFSGWPLVGNEGMKLYMMGMKLPSFPTKASQFCNPLLKKKKHLNKCFVFPWFVFPSFYSCICFITPQPATPSFQASELVAMDLSLERSHRRLVRRWREQLRVGEWNPKWIFNMATWTVNELVPIWILHELDSRSVKRTQKQRQISLFQSNTCAHFGCTNTKLFNNLSAVHLPWNISFHTVPSVFLHIENHQSHSESNSNAAQTREVESNNSRSPQWERLDGTLRLTLRYPPGN